MSSPFDNSYEYTANFSLSDTIIWQQVHLRNLNDLDNYDFRDFRDDLGIYDFRDDRDI